MFLTHLRLTCLNCLIPSLPLDILIRKYNTYIEIFPCWILWYSNIRENRPCITMTWCFIGVYERWCLIVMDLVTKLPRSSGNFYAIFDLLKRIYLIELHRLYRLTPQLNPSTSKRNHHKICSIPLYEKKCL
jgi:hypothetical protein